MQGSVNDQEEKLEEVPLPAISSAEIKQYLPAATDILKERILDSTASSLHPVKIRPSLQKVSLDVSNSFYKLPRDTPENILLML